ncbi:MAG: hypothetical protein KDC44_12050 [Phaeodactylibacter sp.]|nr:hypothetical protein [Phaeodactylibacter sp.]
MNRNYQFVTLLVLGLSMLVADATAQDWTTFQSYESRFKILTPGPLEHHLDTIPTGIGTVPYHTYYFQDPTEGAEINFFMVSHCTYPEGTVHADSTELLNEFFEATIQSALESVDGELIYVDSLTWRDHPSRLWRIDYLEGHYTIKTQAIIADNRYYAVQVIGPKNKAVNRSSSKFFDSLMIFEEEE